MTSIDLTNAPAAIDAPVITDIEILRSPQGNAAKAVFDAFMANNAKNKGPKTGIKAKAISKGDTFYVSIYDINIEPGFNCRDMKSAATLAHIDALARSIATKNVGVQEPFKVYMKGDKLTATNGECRYWAVFRAMEVYGAPIMTVPCRTERPGTDAADRLYTQGTSNMLLPFSMMENGRLYKELVAFGQTAEMISNRLGKSATYINQCIDLQSAPSAAKAFVSSGMLSDTALLDLIRQNLSDDEIVAKIEAGAEVAKTKGRKDGRIMPKDVVEGTLGHKPMTPKAFMKHLFEDAVRHEPTDDGRVVVALDKAKMLMLSETYGIKF